MNSGTTSRRPIVAGQPAAQRLMSNLDYRLTPNVQPLDEGQVAVVLRALADHTAIVSAINYDQPDDDSYGYHEATSFGRWLHNVADDLEGCFE